MMSDGVNRDPADKVVATQTQVPWCAGGRAFRFFMAKDLSLKSDGFCCETSISALATMSPDCPGGGKPEGPEGRRMRTVNTAAFPPEHGSIATGLGAPSSTGCNTSVTSPLASNETSTEAKGRLAICWRSLISCSRRLEAQQVCLIFHTTAATRSSDRKQLKNVTKNWTRSIIPPCWEKAIWILMGHEKLLT